MGSDRDRRQRAVYLWALDTFGDIAADRRERALRFLEEALELAQSAGLTLNDGLGLTHRAFGNPPGDLRTELGSAGMTLVCLAESLELSADACEIDEFSRARKVDRAAFRARQDAKAKDGIAGPCGPERRQNP